MPLEVRKQPKEPIQSLIRRFTKNIKQSGILIRARKTRFRQKPKSEEMRKRAALRKQEMKKMYEKLKKMGQIKK